MITIRPAIFTDMPAIHSLVCELALFEKEPEAVITTVEEYEKDWEQGIFEAIVAEMNTEVVGMTLFYTGYSTWKGKILYLDDFVVRESHRRYGIGQRLFDATLLTAKEKGCKLLKWQVLDWNTSALDFYEKNKAIIEKNWWNGKILLLP